MLAQMPYPLEGAAARGVMRELEKLRNQVDGLRQDGTLDDGALRQLREEWKIEHIYETTGIEVLAQDDRDLVVRDVREIQR